MGDQENERQYIRIGARSLTKKSMQILLPELEQIEAEIRHMRENAKDYYEIISKNYSNKENSKETSEADLLLYKEYCNRVNNVISILGGRGAGKSSALLTLKHKLQLGYYDVNDNQPDYNPADIIMPTILPETMENNSDLLGWILGAFGNIVSGIETDIYQKDMYDFSNNTNLDKSMWENCRRKDNNILKEAYTNVLRQYRYTQRDFQKVMINEYTTFSNYLEDSKKIMDPQNQLLIEFHKFIEKVVEIKRHLRSGGNDEPLIFIFIDDADLSFERCEEVLNVIFRYLSHPNIVTFVAGDLNKFKEVLLINYLNDMKLIDILNPSSFTDTSEADDLLRQYRKLVNNNIKKILPPSLRYHLESYPYEERFNFKYTENSETLRELIRKVFGLKAKQLHIMGAYGVILDRYPRGLMNVYYELYTLLYQNSKENNEQDPKKYIGILKRFIQVIIRSSDVLNKYEREIMQCITIDENKLSRSWINFIKAREIRIDKSEKGELETQIVFYAFISFIESILVTLVQDSEGSNGRLHSRQNHGAEIVYNSIKKSLGRASIHLCPNLKNINYEMKLYYRLIHNVCYYSLCSIKDFGIKHDSTLEYFKVLNEIGIGSESENIEGDYQNLVSLINRAIRLDFSWTDTIFQIVYMNSNQNVAILRTLWTDIISRLNEIDAPDNLIKQVEEKVEILVDKIRSLKIESDWNSNKLKEVFGISYDESEEEHEYYRLLITIEQGYRRVYLLDETIKEQAEKIKDEIKNEEINYKLSIITSKDYLEEGEYEDIYDFIHFLIRSLFNSAPQYLKGSLIKLKDAMKKIRAITVQRDERIESIYRKNGPEQYKEKEADKSKVSIIINHLHNAYCKKLDSIGAVDRQYYSEFSKIHKELMEGCIYYKEWLEKYK